MLRDLAIYTFSRKACCSAANRLQDRLKRGAPQCQAGKSSLQVLSSPAKQSDKCSQLKTI